MAPSLSNMKVLSAIVADSFSVINRRGFAAVAATQTGGATAGAKAGESGRNMIKKQGENKEESWVPDPVTGYYRPENHGDEIDVAELRNALLNHNKTR